MRGLYDYVCVYWVIQFSVMTKAPRFHSLESSGVGGAVFHGWPVPVSRVKVVEVCVFSAGGGGSFASP